MSEIRDFVKKVLPLLPRQPAAPAKASPPAESAQAAEQQAEAGAFKAQVMKRLAALVEPFKQAIADDGPDVPQMHKLFGTIKTNVGKQQFFEASKSLDSLEQLLAQPSTPATDEDQDVADLEKLVGAPSGKQTAAQPPQKLAAAGDKSVVGDVIGPVDPAGVVIPIIKDLLGPLSATCKVTNNTEQTLILDPSSLDEKPHSGEYSSPPPSQIPKSKEEFKNNSKKTLGVSLAGCEGHVRYFID